MDYWHILPGPVMLLLLVCSAGWVVFCFGTVKDRRHPQRGTGLKIMSTVLLLVVIAPNFLTNWVNWPMSYESSRDKRALDMEQAISVVVDGNVQTVTISKEDWDELNRALDKIIEAGLVFSEVQITIGPN